ISTPALRHWEAPRRTTVDARNQPADKRMINRRLKPHRRPCAHFWSGSKPYGSPPGREEFVAPAVDNGHKRRFHHVSNSDKVFGTHIHHIVGMTLGANTFLANVRHWRDTNIGEIDGPEIGHSDTRKPRFELLRRYSGRGFAPVSRTKKRT